MTSLQRGIADLFVRHFIFRKKSQKKDISRGISVSNNLTQIFVTYFTRDRKKENEFPFNTCNMSYICFE